MGQRAGALIVPRPIDGVVACVGLGRCGGHGGRGRRGGAGGATTTAASVDTARQRGHRFPLGDPRRRDGARPPVARRRCVASEAERCAVVIVGAGIAGLAAARALRPRRITDYASLELDDRDRRQQPLVDDGRPTVPHRRALPAVARDHATEVRDLLTELGVRQPDGSYDERMLAMRRTSAC